MDNFIYFYIAIAIVGGIFGTIGIIGKHNLEKRQRKKQHGN